MSKSKPQTVVTENEVEPKQKIKVAIIGAGISGLAVANGLLKDPLHRYDVQLYERDTIAYNSERGGYQLRIASNGLDALKTVCNADTWKLLRPMWGGDEAKAPGLTSPNALELYMRLADIKVYPQSRPIPRTHLRQALLQRPLQENRIHFNHRFERFEHKTEKADGLVLHFSNQPSVEVDIVIAADGSGSTINQQVGLNNKIKLKGWTLIQSRGIITKATRDSLPSSLLECGSVLHLGGEKITGFLSIYDCHDISETGEVMQDKAKEYSLFWSILIPSSKGKVMLEKAGDDKGILISELKDYIRNDLKLTDALPLVIDSALEYTRSGSVTSSFKPTSSWREGNAENSRIILLGDAVHPMTPGRGQGANQAMTDAGKLVRLLHAAKFTPGAPILDELTVLVNTFDKEMYSRAFKMVKASENMTDLDLTVTSGKIKVAIGYVVLTILGWIVTVLETVGLRTPEGFDYVNQDN